MSLSTDDITPRLDPALVPFFAAQPRKAFTGLDATATRASLSAAIEQLRALMPPGGVEVRIEDRRVPGPAGAPEVPVRIYRPTQNATDCALVWIHGGGFIAGSHESEDLVALRWVRETGCTIVSVGYRLAPEHRHPAAVEDCYAALCWVADPTAPLGFAPRKLAIGGMSAGGCLAAATALMARDRGGPSLCFQMLLIPVIDNRHETPSSYEVTDTRTWNRELSMAAWSVYVGPHFLEETSPYAAPARATDLRGLPPAYVEVSEVDNLRDEAIAYANRLMQAGVRTELHVYPGAFHASALLGQFCATSARAMDDSAAALKAALA